MITLEKLRELADKYEAEVGPAVHHFIDYLKGKFEHLFHLTADATDAPAVDVPAPAVDTPAPIVETPVAPVSDAPVTAEVKAKAK